MQPTFGTVMIDYGHGHPLPSNMIKHYTFTDHDDYTCHEWEINRRVAKRLINLLLDYRVKVYDVVAGVWHTDHVRAWTALEQSNVSLRRRVLNANEINKTHRGRCFLLSLHHNLFNQDRTGRGPTDERARGANLFVGKPCSATSKAVVTTMAQVYREHPHSEQIRARNLRCDDWAGWSNRPDLMLGARNWYMLTRTYMPAVLGEMGFYSSWKDVCVFTTPEGQDGEAAAYFEGIKGWLKAADDA